MMKIKIKPLSVNKAWQGRRFKTPDYHAWEQGLLYALPHDLGVLGGDLCLYIEFGLSNKRNDIDNGLKPFLDVLQKKYGFDDNQIYDLRVKKQLVPKGGEYIKFEFLPFDPWLDVFEQKKENKEKV